MVEKNEDAAPAKKSAKKKLRFGGPNLVAGQHTWFEVRDDEGRPQVVQAPFGFEVDVDACPKFQDFIDRGMADLV